METLDIVALCTTIAVFLLGLYALWMLIFWSRQKKRSAKYVAVSLTAAFCGLVGYILHVIDIKYSGISHAIASIESSLIMVMGQMICLKFIKISQISVKLKSIDLEKYDRILWIQYILSLIFLIGVVIFVSTKDMDYFYLCSGIIYPLQLIITVGYCFVSGIVLVRMLNRLILKNSFETSPNSMARVQSFIRVKRKNLLFIYVILGAGIGYLIFAILGVTQQMNADPRITYEKLFDPKDLYLAKLQLFRNFVFTVFILYSLPRKGDRSKTQWDKTQKSRQSLGSKASRNSMAAGTLGKGASKKKIKQTPIDFTPV